MYFSGVLSSLGANGANEGKVNKKSTGCIIMKGETSKEQYHHNSPSPGQTRTLHVHMQHSILYTVCYFLSLDLANLDVRLQFFPRRHPARRVRSSVDRMLG
jgi:hypothetical protein